MELAVSEDAVTVFAHPFLIKDPATRVGATGAAARQSRGRPAQEAQRPQVGLRLPAPQDGRVGAAHRIQELKIEGIDTVVEPKRSYPQG